MKFSYLIITFLTGLFFSNFAHAADISVLPGSGTLAAAVAAAADGDTLVLDYGTYSGNGNLVISKSLTIRSLNSQALSALITGGTFTIDGADINVTLQGLGFSVAVTVLAAADLKVLENSFYQGVDLNVSGYATSDGDGQLTVVGNFFSLDSLLTTINSEDAYIAGNTFDRGHLISNVPVWIVGNSITGTYLMDVINIDTSGFARVLANRVNMPSSASSGSPSDGIEITASAALVAGNIVTVNHASSTNSRRGIIASNTTVARVFNNVVDAGAITTTMSTSSYGIIAYGEVSGNMVINLTAGNMRGITGSGVENNLCFGNYSSDCGATPVTTDPTLVNRIDYHLDAASPAIDAGSVNPFLADLDRTRNDIGAQGGPWSIAQYDAQRDPQYLGPFVYPLFEANSSFVNGQLQVRALGVARLR